MIFESSKQGTTISYLKFYIIIGLLLHV